MLNCDSYIAIPFNCGQIRAQIPLRILSKNVFSNYIYIYIYNRDLALNNLQWLISRPNQTLLCFHDKPNCNLNQKRTLIAYTYAKITSGDNKVFTQHC